MISFAIALVDLGLVLVIGHSCSCFKVTNCNDNKNKWVNRVLTEGILLFLQDFRVLTEEILFLQDFRLLTEEDRCDDLLLQDFVGEFLRYYSQWLLNCYMKGPVVMSPWLICDQFKLFELPVIKFNRQTANLTVIGFKPKAELPCGNTRRGTA